MTISEKDKKCPILLTGFTTKILELMIRADTTIDTEPYGKCIREECLWYGSGCPAYPTQLEIDIYKGDKEFYKELEERDAKSD